MRKIDANKLFQMNEALASLLQKGKLEDADKLDEEMIQYVGTNGRVVINQVIAPPRLMYMYAFNRAMLQMNHSWVQEAVLSMIDVMETLYFGRVQEDTTQYRESYPYYQHEKIGYNYRMSNISAGIGRGQMSIVNKHLAHHKHVQKMYEELLAEVLGIHVHSQPANGDYDSNYWLCTITIDPEVKIKGQENAYKTIVKGAVGGAADVIHMAESATTDCQPNDNVEALRVLMDQAQIEARPVWKPMHKQPVYRRGEIQVSSFKIQDQECLCETSETSVSYVNGVSESLFKIGMCLPAGPYVTDDDVKYIVETIKNAII